jgi:hypothetical protein
MADPEMLYLSTSALVIENDMAGVRVALAEGSLCFLPCSKHGARVTALKLALVARDRLHALIAELEQRS